MRDLTHGRAVRAFGWAGLAAAGFILTPVGCRSDSGGATADAPPATSRPAADEPLPPPQMTREVVARRAITPPSALGDLRPAAVLPPQERKMFYPFSSPALARVERRDGGGTAVVVEAEVGRNAILLIDRRMGVIVDGRVLAAGPLSRTAAYELYVLPPGGVVNEATVTRIRPENEQERRDRAEAERKAAATTSPFPFAATRPNP